MTYIHIIIMFAKSAQLYKGHNRRIYAWYWTHEKQIYNHVYTCMKTYQMMQIILETWIDLNFNTINIIGIRVFMELHSISNKNWA